MASMLKECGENCGLVLRDAVVVIVTPGSPLGERPTAFTKADLDNAVRAGLLEKAKADRVDQAGRVCVETGTRPPRRFAKPNDPKLAGHQ
jgi:hypothetical protein